MGLEEKKEPQISLKLFLCTQSRDRTGMEVNPLVFETSASTNSAIWASCFLKTMQRYDYFLFLQIFRMFFLKKMIREAN